MCSKSILYLVYLEFSSFDFLRFSWLFNASFLSIWFMASLWVGLAELAESLLLFAFVNSDSFADSVVSPVLSVISCSSSFSWGGKKFWVVMGKCGNRPEDCWEKIGLFDGYNWLSLKIFIGCDFLLEDIFWKRLQIIDWLENCIEKRWNRKEILSVIVRRWYIQNLLNIKKTIKSK